MQNPRRRRRRLPPGPAAAARGPASVRRSRRSLGIFLRVAGGACGLGRAPRYTYESVPAAGVCVRMCKSPSRHIDSDSVQSCRAVLAPTRGEVHRPQVRKEAGGKALKSASGQRGLQPARPARRAAVGSRSAVGWPPAPGAFASHPSHWQTPGPSESPADTGIPRLFGVTSTVLASPRPRPG